MAVFHIPMFTVGATVQLHVLQLYGGIWVKRPWEQEKALYDPPLFLKAIATVGWETKERGQSLLFSGCAARVTK